MSVDPYHAVQQEIQGSLQTAAQLQASFVRIRNMAHPDSEELMWARNEVSLAMRSVLRMADGVGYSSRRRWPRWKPILRT